MKKFHDVYTPMGYRAYVEEIKKGVYFDTGGRSPKYFKIFSNGTALRVQELSAYEMTKI